MMRGSLSTRPLLGVLGVLAVQILSTHEARAATQVTAPAGGGLGALTATVDLKGAVVRVGGESVPITLDRALFPEEREIVVESVAIGGDKHVVHVRVPAS